MSSGDLAILLILSLLMHGWGDYIIQTDWMATQKTERWWPALAHAVTYTIPFTPFTLFPAGIPLSNGLIALAVIGGTHAVIDRFRLARYVAYLKVRLSGSPLSWRECSKTGFPPDGPEWLTTWLMIIIDNIIHISINTLVIIWAVKA